MSGSPALAAAAGRRGEPAPGRVRRVLAAIGGGLRRRTHFVLTMAALAYGVARDAPLPSSWRRTARTEFRRALRQAIGGGLTTTLVTAALMGLVMVYQTLYWLGAAGQEELIGTVLVTVLVREVTPVLVGFIVLGRSGMVAVAELGTMQLTGDVHALEAQGIDPFELLVLPRACAFPIACFTLGMVFVLVALVTGFVTDTLLGTTTSTLLAFLDGVLRAMAPGDFAIFPAKMTVIGVLVALASCLTGLMAAPRDDAARLLPHGFVRGVMVILITSIALSLAI